MTQLKFIPNDIRVIKGNKRGGNGSGRLKIYCNVYYNIRTFCWQGRASNSICWKAHYWKGWLWLDGRTRACCDTRLDMLSRKRPSKEVFWDWGRGDIADSGPESFQVSTEFHMQVVGPFVGKSSHTRSKVLLAQGLRILAYSEFSRWRLKWWGRRTSHMAKFTEKLFAPKRPFHWNRRSVCTWKEIEVLHWEISRQ